MCIRDRVRHQAGQGEKLASGKANERWGRLAVDAHGQIWAGHRWNGGLGVRRTDGTWERLSTISDSIPSDAPTAVATDTLSLIHI